MASFIDFRPKDKAMVIDLNKDYSLERLDVDIFNFYDYKIILIIIPKENKDVDHYLSFLGKCKAPEEVIIQCCGLLETEEQIREMLYNYARLKFSLWTNTKLTLSSFKDRKKVKAEATLGSYSEGVYYEYEKDYYEHKNPFTKPKGKYRIVPKNNMASPKKIYFS